MAEKKYKIVIIGSAHPLRGGGIATFNERLARQFIQEGRDVSIESFSLQYPSFLFPGKSQFTDDPAPKDITINSSINSINPLNWVKVGKAISMQRPDIVVVRFWLPFMGPSLGTILRQIKKNNHTKIICIADNVVPHEARMMDKSFTKYFVKPVDAFITMSEKVLADLKVFAPAKPALYVPHPLYDNFGDQLAKEEACKALGISSSMPLLLFFGFIRKYKGLDILLDAMKLLADDPSTKNIHLLIAGEFYDDPKLYQEQIDKLGIREQLILRTDFIADDQVKYYLSAADVVVQPYRSATQSGVTPLAYHFEKPMIVTNVGGLPALVPDGQVGLVAEPTAASLAENIKLFFTMGADHFMPALLQEKKKYSWTNITHAVYELAEKAG